MVLLNKELQQKQLRTDRNHQVNIILKIVILTLSLRKKI